MARGPRRVVPEDVELNVVGTTEDVETNEQEAERELGQYKLAGGMSIPVPKVVGKIWQRRIDDAMKAYDAVHDMWDKVTDEYEKAQIQSMEGIENITDVADVPQSAVDEPIIRDNIRVLMRTAYTQNPHLEFTAMTKQAEPMVKVLSEVFQFMANKETAPGFNLKQHMKRWILHGHFTNFGVMKLDFQDKEGSRDEAINEFSQIEQELQNADSEDEIDRLMGALQALYETMPLLKDKGIKLNTLQSKALILDPETTMYDLSTCNWAVELVPLDENFINEKYYTRDEEGTLRLIANPKHTMKEKRDRTKDETKESVQTEILNTVLGDNPTEQDKLRMQDKTLCYRIYDRMLRRIYLYRHDDMAYPLHVYQDTMNLSRFYPFFILGFNEPVDTIMQGGEPAHYIGYVDEINKTNRKLKQIRDSVFGALLYDKDVADSKEVEKLINHLNNPRKVKAFGIAKAEGVKRVSEMVEVFAPPSIEYEGLFNTANLRERLGKTSNISDIERGEQFKTNTTNKQVDFYGEIKNEATSFISDQVEEQFESLGWAISELIVSKYQPEEIAEMIGEEKAAAFRNMPVPEFNKSYTMVVAAGSTEKPTSLFKRREAMELGQVLGQVGQGAPATVTGLLLRLFEGAFSNFSIREEDWEQLKTESAANLQRGVSTQNGQQQ